MARWKVAGINFDHFHMGDNLQMAAAHPDVEIVAVCDAHPDRMAHVVQQHRIPADRVFTDYTRCLESTRPDVVLLCPSAAEHGVWTERIMQYGADVLIEKPMAASLAEADRMIAAADAAHRQLAINWPMAWYPTHRTAYRIIQEGTIGSVLEVHYYDGNRGPLFHTAGKQECTPDEMAREKLRSWFYRRDAGGGSLLDYLGYGATLATWFNGGQRPLEITAVVDRPPGLEVDEHCIAIARYESGLSKFETRWGTFTDPWTHQPQPKCGFVIVGSKGTISCFDFESTVRLQTADEPQGRDLPLDTSTLVESDPIHYFLNCLETNRPIEGPLSMAVSRIGQQIVETAVQSARSRKTVSLLD